MVQYIRIIMVDWSSIMKKALACLVCAVLVAMSLPFSAAAAGGSVINVSSVSAHAGEAVDVTVDFS